MHGTACRRNEWFERLQLRRQQIQGMGIDISVGESLDDLADLLERAGAPFQDLTWDRIFPMPTAGALAGGVSLSTILNELMLLSPL